jgi:lysophospholipase L1-like esterase
MSTSRDRRRRRSISWIIAGLVLVPASVALGLLMQKDRPLHLLARMPIGQEHHVLFGDSHVELFDATEIPDDARLRLRGYSGLTAAELLPRAEAVVRASPRLIFLVAGANDAFRGHPPQHYRTDMARLMEKLSEADGRLVVLSIPPASDGRMQARIAALNAVQAGLCEEQGIQRIDLDPVLLRQGLLEPSLTTDGVHLNRAGYDRILPLLAPYLREAGH